MISEKRQVRDTQIFTVRHEPEGAQISMILVHGYAEHIMRYERFMEQLMEAGIRFLAFDLRGHGQSDGERVYVDSFDDYARDLKELADGFFQEGEKNFIFGHSVGGLVAIRYLELFGQDLVTGLVTSGAAMKPDDSVPKILVFLAPYIARILPRFPTIKLDGTAVSRDPDEVRKYNEDPLNYRGKTKAKFGNELLEAMKTAKSELGKISLPIFINHGSKDRLIDPESAQWIYDGVSSSDKNLKMWDGLYHEILNEPEKDEIAKEIIEWITARAK